MNENNSPMNETQNIEHFGVDKANGSDKNVTHQLTIDELPKHTNSLDVPDMGNYLPAQYGQVKAEPKHWYQSKTIWFNTISGVAALATSATPALEGTLTAVDFAILLAAVNLVNAVLRKFTNKPIKGGGNG